MAAGVSLNRLAIEVREETLQAVTEYLDQVGATDDVIETLNSVLEKSQHLKKKRDESVAICSLNLAAAYIGQETHESIETGQRMLDKLKTEEETKQKTDNVLFAYISYHLGLVSEFYKNRILSKENSSESLTEWLTKELEEKIDEQMKHLKMALVYLEEAGKLSKISNGCTDIRGKSLKVSKKESETTKEVLILKERTLVRVIQVWMEKGQRLEQEREEMENEIIAHMTQLYQVYETLYSMAKRGDNTISEGDILEKEAMIALLLATFWVQFDSSKGKAKDWAEKCFKIFDKDWTHVQASVCSELGTVYTEIKEHERAKTCFLKLQVCSQSDKSSHAINKSYMFQNLGAVHVLQNKYDVAIHYFNEALHVLESRDDQTEVAEDHVERRAHLYLNLGFAWSQTGRGNIWKTFEAYYNAALLASDKACKEEGKLRQDALKGMTLAAIVIRDYRGELVEFVYTHVIYPDENGDSKTSEIQTKLFEEIPEMAYTALAPVSEDKRGKGDEADTGVKGDNVGMGRWAIWPLTSPVIAPSHGDEKYNGRKGDKEDKRDKVNTGNKGGTGDKEDKGDKVNTGNKGGTGDKEDKGDKVNTGNKGGTGDKEASRNKGDNGNKGGKEKKAFDSDNGHKIEVNEEDNGEYVKYISNLKDAILKPMKMLEEDRGEQITSSKKN